MITPKCPMCGNETPDYVESEAGLRCAVESFWCTNCNTSIDVEYAINYSRRDAAAGDVFVPFYSVANITHFQALKFDTETPVTTEAWTAETEGWEV